MISFSQQIDDSVCLLKHLQVFSLHIFQQGEDCAVTGSAIGHNGGNFPKTGNFTGAKPSFTGDEVIDASLFPTVTGCNRPFSSMLNARLLSSSSRKVFLG